MTNYSKVELKNRLQSEFLKLDKTKNVIKRLPNVIIVLAAEEINVSGENKQRIDVGVRLVKKLNNMPSFVYIGTKAHNEHVRKYLKLRKINFILISGENDQNTKDQIVGIGVYLKSHFSRSIIIVSHIYHIPRIKRYCKIYLPNVNILFWKIGKLSNFDNKVKEEIEKIIEYSKKGDLPLFL